MPKTRQAPARSRDKSFFFRGHGTGKAAIGCLNDRDIIVIANAPIGKLILGDIRRQERKSDGAVLTRNTTSNQVHLSISPLVGALLHLRSQR